MKITALLLSSSLALSACVSTTTPPSSGSLRTSSAGVSSEDVNSGPLSVQTSDVQVYAAAASPTSSRTAVVGPVFFSPSSSTSTRGQFPVSVVYALKDNPRTQRIKSKGAIVYVEATPFLVMHRLLPDGTRDTRELGANIEEYRYGCARTSRMVALAPANNYRVAYVTDQEIFIRTKDVPGYPDRTITGIDAGGRVDQASLRPIKTKFRKTCYVRRTQEYFN
ncbi:hypothetical protein NOI20_07515 [Rhodobacteraceae bacterium 10Alg 79]|uniref:Lipoprotein n=2 Tax=Rhodalgimonas zhirmunskyi TaxID=2964767 RepID=A0AAJ1X5T5_9RHOB|nr:hypothetical protein [Rhodoalgimonas zhirmunskyi]